MKVSYLAAGLDVNSGWLYLLYVGVAVFVLGQAAFYLVRALKRAKVLNIDKEKIKTAITSSVSFTILPAIGIFIGLVTLVGFLGIPIPAIRLSVVGALQYETLAASMVAEGMAEGGIAELSKNMTPTQFVTIVSAMTFGIVWGPLFCLIAFKKIFGKMSALSKKSSSGKWQEYMTASIFVGMVVAFFAVSVSNILNPSKATLEANGGNLMASVKQTASLISSYYYLIAVVVSCLTMWGCDVLVKKCNQKWLESFSLALSMIVGMTIVAVISYFTHKNAAADPETSSELVKLLQFTLLR